MTLKEIDPVLREIFISWLKAIRIELRFEEPNIEMLLKEVQMMIDALTPFPDVLKAIKELESAKEGVLDLQN